MFADYVSSLTLRRRDMAEKAGHENKDRNYQEDYLFQMVEEIKNIVNNNSSDDKGENKSGEPGLFHVSIYLYDKRHDTLILRASTHAHHNLGREGIFKDFVLTEESVRKIIGDDELGDKVKAEISKKLVLSKETKLKIAEKIPLSEEEKVEFVNFKIPEKAKKEIINRLGLPEKAKEEIINKLGLPEKAKTEIKEKFKLSEDAINDMLKRIILPDAIDAQIKAVCQLSDSTREKIYPKVQEEVCKEICNILDSSKIWEKEKDTRIDQFFSVMKKDQNLINAPYNALLLGESVSIVRGNRSPEKGRSNIVYKIQEGQQKDHEFTEDEIGGLYVIPLTTEDKEFGGREVLKAKVQNKKKYCFALIRITTDKSIKLPANFVERNFDDMWIETKSNIIRNTFSLSELIAIGSDMDVENLCKLAAKMLSRALQAKGCSIFLADNYGKNYKTTLEVEGSDKNPEEIMRVKERFLESQISYRCFGTTGLIKFNEWKIPRLVDGSKENYQYKLAYEFPNIDDRALKIPMTCGVIRSRQNAFIDDIDSRNDISEQFSSDYRIDRKPGHGKACEHFIDHDKYYRSGSIMFVPLFYREPDSRATEVLGVIRILRPKSDTIEVTPIDSPLGELDNIIKYNSQQGDLSFKKIPTADEIKMVKAFFKNNKDIKKIEKLYEDFVPPQKNNLNINIEAFDSKAKHFFVSYVEKLSLLIANARLNEFLKRLPGMTELKDIYDHIMWIIPRIIGGSDCSIIRIDEEEKCLWNVREWRTIKLNFEKKDFEEHWDRQLQSKFDDFDKKQIITGVYLDYADLEKNEKGIKEYDLKDVWDKKNDLSEEELENIGYTGWFALQAPEEGMYFNSPEDLEGKYREKYRKKCKTLPKHRKGVNSSPSRKKYFNTLAEEDSTSRFLACPIFSRNGSSKQELEAPNSDPGKLFGIIRVCKGYAHTPFTDNDLRILLQIVNQMEVVIDRILKKKEQEARRKNRYHRYFPEVIKESLKKGLTKGLTNLWEGDKVIETEIVEQIKNLWKKYGEIWNASASDIQEIIEQFAVIDDKVLQSIMPHYRDHLIHQCVVFSIGNEIIYQLGKLKNEADLNYDIKFDRLCSKAYRWDENDVLKNEASWFLAANFHDVGIPIEKVNLWIEGIICKFFKGIKEPLEKVDVNKLIQSVQSLSDAFDDLVVFHAEQTNDQQQAVDSLFRKLLIDKRDHALISATILQSMKRLTAFDSTYLSPISSAITLHNQMLKERHLHSLSFNHHPLGFLLAFCDLLHEWGRNKLELTEKLPDKSGSDDDRETELDTLWFGIYSPKEKNNNTGEKGGNLIDLGKDDCTLVGKSKADLLKLLDSLKLEKKAVIIYANLSINNLDLFDGKRKEVENHFRILHSNNPIFVIQLSGESIYSTYRLVGH
jgi:hypothetical protein